MKGQDAICRWVLLILFIALFKARDIAFAWINYFILSVTLSCYREKLLPVMFCHIFLADYGILLSTLLLSF